MELRRSLWAQLIAGVDLTLDPEKVASGPSRWAYLHTGHGT
jgi:hypothetical protein